MNERDAEIDRLKSELEALTTWQTGVPTEPGWYAISQMGYEYREMMCVLWEDGKRWVYGAHVLWHKLPELKERG